VNVAYGSGDAGLAALLLLLISLAVTWLIIYSAVRGAVGHALDRKVPRLVADAQTTQGDVHFTVSNIGSGAAFDVTVGWVGRATGEPLARTPLLGPNCRLEWTLSAGSLPTETLSVGRLKVDWAPDNPSVGRRSDDLAVLIPAGLDAAG
jgi:hypothetical protein